LILRGAGGNRKQQSASSSEVLRDFITPPEILNTLLVFLLNFSSY